MTGHRAEEKYAKLRKPIFISGLIAMLVIGLYSPWRSVPIPYDIEDFTSGAYFERLDEHIRSVLPYQENLRRINLQTGLISGQSMQNDIFISQSGLIRNISAKVPLRVQDDIDAVIQFSTLIDRPTYLMLIPTASAILQQHLPQYAGIYLNQRRFIDDTSVAVWRYVTPINVYPTLFNRREEYIFYRTQDNLTALGGYYVYQTLASRLGIQAANISTRDMYDISYPIHSFYGDLFRLSPYSVVRPDSVMVFRHRRQGGHIVTHINGDDVKIYHTLFPTHLAALGREMDIFFGGVSAITRVSSSQPGRSILIFGDQTAKAYLPFLTANYSNITLVDLSQLTPENFGDVSVENYNQILFAFSVDTFGSGTLRLENAARLM